MRLFGEYLKPHILKVAILAIIMFASMGLQLVIPLIVRAFIDQALLGAEVGLLIKFALAFLAAALVNQVLSASSTYLSAHIGWSATNALRSRLFDHIIHLDMRYHKERTPGELIERIDGDVTHLSNFLSQFVVRVVGSLLLIFGILILLARENLWVGIVLTIYAVAVFLVLVKQREVAIPASEMERESNAQLFGFIEERLAGLDDIRANGAGGYVMHRLLSVHRDWYSKSLRAWQLRSSIWTTMIVLFTFGTVLTLGLGVFLYRQDLITIGTAYLFFNYMAMLEAPIDEVTRQLQEFQRAGASVRRVQDVLGEKQDVIDGEHSLKTRQAHAIEFANVSFAYEEQNVLKNVSFTLKPGERLGLLGRTGSGKTTLIRLLFRFHDVTDGQILIDGIDLRQTSLKALRRSIGLVTQDVQLFQGTVRDNLSFFDPTVSDQRLISILEALGLGTWFRALPQGLDTELQAGGGGLSAGESQLLAFTRVFLQNPGLIILDEASSRLDPVTERLVNDATDRLLQGRTGIIIAHRLESVERVDKIMVLKDGHVLEFGDRHALASDPTSAYYAMLSAGGSVDLDERMEQLGL